MTFEKIETATYALLWAFAIYVAAGKLEDKPEPKPEPAAATQKAKSAKEVRK